MTEKERLSRYVRAELKPHITDAYFDSGIGERGAYRIEFNERVADEYTGAAGYATADGETIAELKEALSLCRIIR